MQVPHIFSPGFPARSGEVNENFKALADAITALEARVAALEGGSPVPGRYFLMGFQTGLQAFGGREAVIEGIVSTGNVTLAPGGGATLVLNEFKNELHTNPDGAFRTGGQTLGETIQATWSISEETGGLQIFVPDDTGQVRRLRFGRAAARLHIGNHLNPNDGSTVMLFLIRQPG
ncbi:MAG TPA: hypothetical protein VGD76_04005 [Ramlibacter sp.]